MNDELDSMPTWVRVVLIIALLALLAAIAGCSDSSAVHVDEHTLPDGTRCAVAVDSFRHVGGLSCDWQSAQPTVRMPAAGEAYITAGGDLSWRQ